MLKTGRSKKLDSFFLDNQVWGALHKAWKGYVIAKNKGEDDKMKLYARRIQELQHDLGLVVSSFPNIGMSATNFLCELAQKDADNQEQKVSDEQYRTKLISFHQGRNKMQEMYQRGILQSQILT